MENKFYVGEVYHSKRYNKNFKVEKTVLYSNDNIIYIDLLNEKEYTTNNDDKDYVIKDSLIATDINNFKKDYNYLLYRYTSGNIKRKKKHWYNFKKTN